MTEQMNIKEMQELIKMKKDNPEEYKQFLQGLKEVMIDTIKIAGEVTEELK